MAIKTDRTNLPPADLPGTRAPDRDPWLISALLRAWKAERDAEEAEQTHDRPPEAPYFASDAGTPCTRALYYSLSGVEREPMDLPTEWKLNLGRGVHKTLENLPLPAGWFPEVRFDLGPIGIPGRGRADLVLYDHIDDAPVTLGDRGWELSPDTGDSAGAHTVVDYMTQNGFGYKIAAIPFKGGPEGPKLGKIIQVALAVVRFNAEQGIVAHFAMENIGPDFKSIPPDDLLRCAAQWTITREECDEFVDAERARVQRVLAAREAKVLPVRTLRLPNVPPNAQVVDPERGAWEVRRRVKDEVRVVQAGTSWACGYCAHKEKCIIDGPGGSDEEGTF